MVNHYFTIFTPFGSERRSLPKKFFHTAGNFREDHEEATKAGFSHPVMP